MTIEEILKDIEENRLMNPRVAVVRTLEATLAFYKKHTGIDESILCGFCAWLELNIIKGSIGATFLEQ